MKTLHLKDKVGRYVYLKNENLVATRGVSQATLRKISIRKCCFFGFGNF